MRNLAPAVLNCTLCSGLGIYAGSEWRLPVQICDRTVEAGHISDIPIDLSGLSGRASIKHYAGEENPIAVPTVEITDAAEGRILISLSAEETAAIVTRGNTWREAANFVWDCYLDEESTGESYRILMGSIEVSPKVTDGND